MRPGVAALQHCVALPAVAFCVTESNMGSQDPVRDTHPPSPPPLGIPPGLPSTAGAVRKTNRPAVFFLGSPRVPDSGATASSCGAGGFLTVGESFQPDALSSNRGRRGIDTFPQLLVISCPGVKGSEIPRPLRGTAERMLGRFVSGIRMPVFTANDSPFAHHRLRPNACQRLKRSAHGSPVRCRSISDSRAQSACTRTSQRNLRSSIADS